MVKTDYWSKLKLNESLGKQERFNFLMDKIESAITGDSHLAEEINELIGKFERLIIPSKTSELTNDSGFLTEHQSLEDYICKSETTGLITNTGSVDTTVYLSEHQDISGKVDRTELFKNGVFNTTMTNSRGSVSLIFNESDGGGTKFTDNSSGVVSFVGVNEGSRDGDIYVQIYSKTKSTNDGVRLNFNPNGAFYTVGTSKNWTSDDEIATKGDLNELLARIEALENNN